MTNSKPTTYLKPYLQAFVEVLLMCTVLTVINGVVKSNCQLPSLGSVAFVMAFSLLADRCRKEQRHDADA